MENIDEDQVKEETKEDDVKKEEGKKEEMQVDESNHDKAKAEEVARESRKLLSKTAAIPEFLNAKFEMRSDVTVVHVQHSNTVLPHFQCRLPAGEMHLGKFRNENYGLILFFSNEKINQIM